MEISDQELKETFDHFDRDDNGKIDRREFGELLDALGADMTEEDKDVGFDIIDTNHNQQIEFREFNSWWGEQ
jgi:Ca2+-binding EF-hand superfamily protein